MVSAGAETFLETARSQSRAVEGLTMERENGIVLGVVTDLNDPENLGRVRVRLPHLNERSAERLVARGDSDGRQRSNDPAPQPAGTVVAAGEVLIGG
jgi:hypothetical protein